MNLFTSKLLVNSIISIRPLHMNIPQILLKKYDIDFSRVPKLSEDDIVEQFVRGSGPGGQSVNKTMNCVVLKHNPSGFVVKCHETRSLENNREIARQKLINKLDEQINGENSIANQKKRIDDYKQKQLQGRKEKLNKLKEKWKKREGLLKTK